MKIESQTIIGILAHVDAGKTTLAESILYNTGTIRQKGRVDHGDTFLDYQSIERKRGITVFSKQAEFQVGERCFTLIDTPGHPDLSVEMERTLQVIDIAILVVSATEGVQPHTETIIYLLEKYHIPTIVFMNKCDRPEIDKQACIHALSALDSRYAECNLIFDNKQWCLDSSTIEALALTNENRFSYYLNERTGTVDWMKEMQAAVGQRELIPCVCGSALIGDGLDILLACLVHFSPVKQYGDTTAAQTYKIIHDSHGQRLTLLKVTGGILKVKDTIFYSKQNMPDKINQLLRLHGDKFTSISVAKAGEICAATGITEAKPGDTLTTQQDFIKEIEKETTFYIQPVLETSMTFSESSDITSAMRYIRQIAAEEPELSIQTLPDTKSVQLRVMGTIQMEVLTAQIYERFGLNISFSPCNILYKETIEGSVMGYGHYEPLGHYAEVQVQIDAGQPGQGIIAKSKCNLDELERRHQNLILSHILEKQHSGVLTGEPLTDVTITLIAAKYDLRDSSGGDLRQATYRAIRQGLMKSKSLLLEPWYSFFITLPAELTGRAISDIQRLHGEYCPPVYTANGRASLEGKAPVSTFLNYPLEVISYTQGKGVVSLKPAEYRPCHNPDVIISNKNYDPERDLENTPNSIFFAKGAGYEVKWQDVDKVHHI